MKEIIENLLKLSDEQLDSYAKQKLKRWLDLDEIDQPGYLLCIIDDIVHGSLSSSFELQVLNTLWETTKKKVKLI